jgi:hypothetical protein
MGRTRGDPKLAHLDFIIQVLRLTDKTKAYSVFQDVIHRGRKAFPGLDRKQVKRIAETTRCPYYRSRSDLPDLFLWVATFYDAELIANIKNKALQKSSLEREIVVRKYGLNDDDDAGVFHHMHESIIPQPVVLNEKIVSYSFMDRTFTVEELRDAVRTNAVTVFKATDALSSLVKHSGDALPLMLDLIRGAGRIIRRRRRSRRVTSSDVDREAERAVMETLYVELNASSPAPAPAPAPPSSKTAGAELDPEITRFVSRKIKKLDEQQRAALKASATALATVRATKPDGIVLDEATGAAGAPRTPPPPLPPPKSRGEQDDGSVPVYLKWSLYDRGIEYVREMRKLGARCQFMASRDGEVARLDELPAYRIVSFPRIRGDRDDGQQGREDWFCYDVVELFRYVRDFASPSYRKHDSSYTGGGGEAGAVDDLRRILAEAGMRAQDVPLPNTGPARYMNDVDLSRLQIWYESYLTLEDMMKGMNAAERSKIEQIAEHLVPSQVVDSQSGWARWIGRKLYNTLTYQNPKRKYLRAYGARDLIYGTSRASDFILSWLPYTIGVHALLTILEGLLCILVKAYVIASWAPISMSVIVGTEIRAFMGAYLKTSIVNFLREVWARLTTAAQSKYAGLLVALVIGMIGRWLKFQPLIALSDWVRDKSDTKTFKVVAFSATVVGVMVGVSIATSVGGYLWDGLLRPEEAGTLLTDRFMSSIHSMAANVPVFGPMYSFLTQGVSSPTTWVGAEQASSVAMYFATTFSGLMCKLFSLLGKKLESGCTSVMSFAARHLGHAVIVSKVLRILWDVSYFMFTGGTRLLFTPCFRYAAISHRALDLRLDSSKPVPLDQKGLAVGETIIDNTAKKGELRQALGEVFKGYEDSRLRYRLDGGVADHRAAEIGRLKSQGAEADAALLALEEYEMTRSVGDLKEEARHFNANRKQTAAGEHFTPSPEIIATGETYEVLKSTQQQLVADHDTSSEKAHKRSLKLQKEGSEYIEAIREIDEKLLEDVGRESEVAKGYYISDAPSSSSADAPDLDLKTEGALTLPGGGRRESRAAQLVERRKRFVAKLESVKEQYADAILSREQHAIKAAAGRVHAFYLDATDPQVVVDNSRKVVDLMNREKVDPVRSATDIKEAIIKEADAILADLKSAPALFNQRILNDINRASEGLGERVAEIQSSPGGLSLTLLSSPSPPADAVAAAPLGMDLQDRNREVTAAVAQSAREAAAFAELQKAKFVARAALNQRSLEIGREVTRQIKELGKSDRKANEFPMQLAYISERYKRSVVRLDYLASDPEFLSVCADKRNTEPMITQSIRSLELGDSLPENVHTTEYTAQDSTPAYKLFSAHDRSWLTLSIKVSAASLTFAMGVLSSLARVAV